MTLNRDYSSISRFLHEITAAEVMTSPVHTIKQDEDFAEVAKKFVDYGIRHLPVVDGERRIIGVMTKRDLFRTVAPRKAIENNMEYSSDKILDGLHYYSKDLLNQYILREVMVKNPVTAGEDASLGEIIHLMVGKKIGCIPIIRENKTVSGIITQVNILRKADEIYTTQ
ncbi:MAG: CBS domain-containing protein [Candidatus Omnitrophica bacterium]|nr:CBS domain-containing protein [Candidatus Omnitrophota bacterium]